MQRVALDRSYTANFSHALGYQLMNRKKVMNKVKENVYKKTAPHSKQLRIVSSRTTQIIVHGILTIVFNALLAVNCSP